MPIWNARWLVYTALSVIFWNSPRVVYIIFLVVDVLMIGITTFTTKGIWNHLGVLFLAQEILLLIWHLCQFILFLDYYSGNFDGDGKMSEGTVKFWIVLCMIMIFGTMGVEIAIWVFGVLAGKDAKIQKENSSDVELEIGGSGSQLNQKIKEWTKMRTGNRGQGLNQMKSKKMIKEGKENRLQKNN